MASPNIWGNGLGGTGVDRATLGPSYFSASVIWLNSNGGSDANAGTEPELPKATLSSAAAACAANSVIAVASGHSETIASTVTLAAAGIRILGFGTGISRPKFTCNTTTTDMITSSAGYCVIDNCYFPAAAQSTTGYKIDFSQIGCKILDCYFECSGNTTLGDVLLTSNSTVVRSCSFVATSIRPAIGILMTSAGSGNVFEDLTFDGTTFGWTDYALKITGAQVNLEAKNITLMGKADMGLTATGAGYQLYGVIATGASRVLITA